MIFEAEAVKAGGGESWIPVCLPGFNSSGYLYMYVSFLDLREDAETAAEDTATTEESVAIILISTDKESFFEMQKMRDSFVEVRTQTRLAMGERPLTTSSSKWRRMAASKS
jgi:hypothetical protein